MSGTKTIPKSEESSGSSGSSESILKSLIDAKGDIISATADDTPSIVAVGADTQVLTADSSQVSGVKWATPLSGGMTDPMTTRGDVIVKNSSNVTSRLPIGSNGQVLKSNGSDIAWAEESGGSVDSVFNRTGVIIAASGDYNADEISETDTNKILTSTERSNIASSNAHKSLVTGNPHVVTKAEVGLSNVPNIDCTNASNITNGTLPSGVLPPIALTSVTVYSSESLMLSATTEEGDVVVRSDENKSYMNNGGSTGTMADWTELQTPTDSVLSVNGEIGTVVLTTGDLAEDTDNNYVTDAEKIVIGNTSGTNTGDDPADDTAYDATTWDANVDAATKNALRDKFVVNDAAIALNTAKISYPGSADAAELNILDGATLTTTELNYVDGVTSNIQTQLDGKAASLGSDDNYVTDAEKIVIGNTSGTNTGDQDLSVLATKANVLELDNTTSFTPDADYEPATKKYVDDNSGGGLSWSVLATNLNPAVVNNGYLINASGGDITLTLPASPSEGDTIGVCDVYDKATTNTITVGRNGSNIEGSASDLIIDKDGSGMVLVYTDATRGWEIVSEIGSGLGAINNTLTVAKSGGQYTSIQSAINASVSGDTILIYDGIYTEAVTTKAGGSTTLVGMGTMGSVVIQQDVGTCLTVPSTPMSMAFIKNLKIKSNTSGVNQSKLFVGSGMMTTFNSVSFDYDIANGYTSDIIDLDAGSYVFSGCKLTLNQTGTVGGEIQYITASGTVEFNVMQGFGRMTIAGAAVTDSFHFIANTSSGESIVRDFDIELNASAESYAGHIDFLHSTNSTNFESMGNKIVISTPSGIGSSYGQAYHLAGSGGGHVHSTANRIDVEGFANNYIGNIASTETLYSHFDDIVAPDNIIGTGVYSYVNSPANGDLQMSGDIIKKVVNITADYDDTEDWEFGILNASPTSADITAIIKESAFTSSANGSYRIFLNSSDTYNLILDPNGIAVGGSASSRAIYPGGYIIVTKIGDAAIITGSRNTSFNIDLADVPNKTFHLDFSDASSVTTSGDDITAMTESINSWSGDGTTLSGRIKYGLTTQNGLNTGLWNVSNSTLNFGDRDLHSNLTNRGLTIITVIKPKYGGDAIISKYADNVPNAEWRFLTNSAAIYNELDRSGSEATLNFSSNYEEWQLLSMFWEPGGRLSVYKNGFLMGTSSYVTDEIPAGTADLMVGISDISGMDYLGEIGEIIAISDTLTQAMREAIVSKLGAKWGIDTAVFSASDSSPFGRDDETTTIKPLVNNDNLDIGTGTLIAGGSDIQGGQTINITPVNAATYDLQATDYILHVIYTTTGPVTSLTLLTAQCVDGRIIRIKDAGGNAATNNITVDTEGSETIDGVSTFILNTNSESVDFYAYNGNWFTN